MTSGTERSPISRSTEEGKSVFLLENSSFYPPTKVVVIRCAIIGSKSRTICRTTVVPFATTPTTCRCLYRHRSCPQVNLLLDPISTIGSKNNHTARSRRSDVFGAFRRRGHHKADDECRRREAHEGRSSDEVFAGMLVRSRHDARVCAGGQDGRGAHDRPCIALLRANCQRPAVQWLYGTEEVGLGQTMKVDKDVSVWGSDSDDDDTVTFKGLLAEEGRRWVPEMTASFSSSSSSFSREQQPFLRCRRRVPCARKRKPLATSEALARLVDDSKSACEDSSAAVPSAIVEENRVESLTMPCSASSSSNGEGDQQATEAGCVKTQKGSEGVQCSGPPVDRGIQTSSLRLPRSSCSRYRVLGTRSPTLPEAPEALPPPKTLSEDGNREKSRLPHATKTTAEAPRNKTGTPETPLKPMIRCSMGVHAAARMHVRQGFEGIRDADHGRRPTAVQAAASGEVFLGQIVMLPLDGGMRPLDGGMRWVQCWRNAAKDVITPRKFLRVVDWVDDRGSFVSRNVEDGDVSAVLLSAADSLPTHIQESKNCTLGEGPSAWEDGHRQDLCGREDPLDLVWKGVGCLDERLAEVDTFFGQLEQDMDHDREVVESYHKEAVEEIEIAARDLRNMRSRRASSHSAYGLEAAEVPIWRSRMDTFDNAFPSRDAMREDATERELQGQQHGSNSSTEDRGDLKSLAAQEAASAAEDELREARTLLKSIEQEMATTTGTVTAARSSR